MQQQREASPEEASEASPEASDWPISIEHVNAKFGLAVMPLVPPQVLPPAAEASPEMGRGRTRMRGRGGIRL